jgi:hypothetical protein
MEKFLNKLNANRVELYQAGELVLVGCVLFGMMVPIASLV